MNEKNGKGQNQTMARDANLSIIMNSFLNTDLSRVDISRKFNLSKPTASKITAELESLGLICEGEEDHADNVPGVKALKYTINSDLGLIAVLDLSTVEIKALLYNFGGECLSEIVMADKEVIRYSDIGNLCDLLDNILRGQAFGKYELLTMCVAIPCAVNKKTGKIYWSARFDIDEDFDFKQYLENRYGVKTIIKNDVQLMLLGETSKGLLADGKHPYALLMYIDAGIGGSFFMNGRLEDGADGTAGDLGFMPYYEDGTTYLLDSVISINTIKKKLRAEMADGAQTTLKSQENLHFKDIEAAYLGGDALTVKIVDETAVKAATVLKSILEIFNLNFVIICGRITRLGDRYLQIIRDYLLPYFPGLKINYTALGDNAIRSGAMMLAQDAIIREKISNRRVD